MQRVSVVIVDPGDDLGLLTQAAFLRVVVAQSPGSWLFAGAATCRDGHPHGFTRVVGLPGMHPCWDVFRQSMIEAMVKTTIQHKEMMRMMANIGKPFPDPALVSPR